MLDIFSILIATVLVHNYVLVKFLGLCPFMGVSHKPEAAVGMGVATAFVLTLTSCLSYALYHWVLAPLDIAYLQTIVFIVSIAAVVGFCDMFMLHTSPVIHQMLGVYLPLITSNCAVLGVALLNVRTAESIVEAGVYGLGAALGFSLVLTLFALLRERLTGADVPQPFQGVPIALITVSIMALAFMGFGGLV